MQYIIGLIIISFGGAVMGTTFNLEEALGIATFVIGWHVLMDA